MRKLMLFTLGFCVPCALFAYFYINWLWILGAVCVCCALILHFVAKERIWIRRGAVILLGCFVGYGWTQLYSGIYLKPALEMDANDHEVCITVTDYSYETDYGIASDGLLFVNGRPYGVKFYMNNNEKLSPGDTVSGNFRFRLTTGFGTENPTYHRSEGKFLLLYDNGDTKFAHASKVPWFCYPAVWRNRLLEALNEIFPKDTTGFAQALLLGERGGLDYETQTALKVSGIQHVVAVSGLHISILCVLFQILTLRKRYLTLFVATPLLIIFAAVVGFTPSVTRACVMQILMLLAQVTDDEYDPPTALAFSVLIMLTVNPMSITSVSFQLSIGCVIGILLFYSRIKGWILSRKWFGSAKGKGLMPKLKRWCSTSVAITLSAMVITTPLVACYFGAVSLIGVITNLLTLWCISFVFYGIIGCCILNFFGFGLSSLVAVVISWPIRYVLTVAKFCAKMPLAAVYTQSEYVVIWLIVCYVLLFTFMLMRNKHPLVLLSCCVILLMFAVTASWLEPRLYTTYATFLDVGQGQCVILQSGGHTFLVDCGGSQNSEAADVAAEALLSRGVSRVDGIVLTHYDRDHAGGVAKLLTRIQADYIYLPDIWDNTGIGAMLSAAAQDKGVLVSEDQDVLFNNGKMRIFAPAAYDLGNESGICVLFQTENCDILITGDRGRLGEMLLLHEHTLPKLEVLVAGHHGSSNSTTEEFLTETHPETVVISVGEGNPYGHPSQSLLNRLKETGCIVYRTDINGTIIYRR